MTAGQPILVSSFVADTPAESSAYPSAGADSSTAAFQAIYWRCLVVEMLGARLFNPHLRLVVVSNVAPPTVDGVDLVRLFDRLSVEWVRRALTHRLNQVPGSAWGNVLYFYDILQWQADEVPDARLILLDSDVVVTGPLDELFEALRTHPVLGYTVETAPDEPLNGSTRTALTRIAAARFGRDLTGPVAHLGGELLGVRGDALGDWLPGAEALWADLAAGSPDLAGVTTEEHVWSLLFPGIDVPVGDAGRWIKRMWTDPRHNTVRAGDQRRPLWHLPAEKRHGFLDLFRWCRARGFDTDLPPAEFRAAALRLCGVPRASFAKVMRDGLRRLRRRLPDR